MIVLKPCYYFRNTKGGKRIAFGKEFIRLAFSRRYRVVAAVACGKYDMMHCPLHGLAAVLFTNSGGHETSSRPYVFRVAISSVELSYVEYGPFLGYCR